MIARDLAESRDRGEVADILIAAEYPIYGRFGYGPAVRRDVVGLDVRRRPLRGAGGRAHRVRGQRRPSARRRRRCSSGCVPRGPGMISRNDLDWDVRADLRRHPEDKPWQGFRLLCTDDDGTARATPRTRSSENGTRCARRAYSRSCELLAATTGAEARLWRFLAELDWVIDGQGGRPSDRRAVAVAARQRAAGQAARRASTSSGCARSMSPRAADGARLHRDRAGRRSRSSTTHGLAAGRFALDASPDGATCIATTEAAPS